MSIGKTFWRITIKGILFPNFLDSACPCFLVVEGRVRIVKTKINDPDNYVFTAVRLIEIFTHMYLLYSRNLQGLIESGEDFF